MQKQKVSYETLRKNTTLEEFLVKKENKPEQKPL